MKKYKLNTTLFTKDGSIFGNAIIIGYQRNYPSGDFSYKLKTDYGNELVLTDEQIEFQFKIGPVSETHKYAIFDYRKEFTKTEESVNNLINASPQMLLLLQRLTDCNITTPLGNNHPIKSEIRQLLRKLL